RQINASPVRDRLLAALDRWLLVDRSDEFVAILHAADPDPFRDEVRAAVRANDLARLLQLAAAPDALRQPARFAIALGANTAIPGGRREAILKAPLLTNPGDFTLLLALGALDRLTLDDRLGWNRAALAARPASPVAWNNLGCVWSEMGERAGALAAF